jgi:hypothetical protein
LVPLLRKRRTCGVFVRAELNTRGSCRKNEMLIWPENAVGSTTDDLKRHYPPCKVDRSCKTLVQLLKRVMPSHVSCCNHGKP